MTAEEAAHTDRHAGFDEPVLTPEDVQVRLAAELSRRGRIGHVLLLLVGLGVAVGISSLLLTEPALPNRTRAAFVAIVLIALGWTTYAWWALTRRDVLLARHRIVAARMAVAFCGLFVVGSVVLVWAGPSAPAALMSAGTGALAFGAAWAALRRARRHVDFLLRRRAELERALAVERERER